MNKFSEIFILIRNAALVTGAVILGSLLGNALGIPIWLQAFCLLPAGYLFICLFEEGRPPASKWLPFGLALSLFIGLIVGITSLIRSRFPELSDLYSALIFFFLVAIAPVQLVTGWLQRLWPQKQGAAPRSAAPGDGEE
ncbi:MAG: hypothetical protein ACR2RV_11400 [Verrucomicrobiales bacterium]